jgi:hypothetical protein
MIGISSKSNPGELGFYPGANSFGWSYYAANGTKNNAAQLSYGASYTAGDVIGVALDVDNGTLTFYKNNTSQGTAYTGLTTGPYYPAIGHGGSTQAFVTSANFGQRPFAYTAPSGFKALNTANLPAPLVTKPNTVMDVALYTGNGSTQTISGLGFSPDLVWIKARSGTAHHFVFDTIRGIYNRICTSLTVAEASEPNTLTAFNSDGFSLASDAGVGGVNLSTVSYVAWTWDAGSSTVTNTQGSITSQVRANPSAGFSVVTWTGNGASSATVGHGLGVAPVFYVSKNRSASGNWQVLTTVINGSMQYGFLNLTNGFAAAGQTAPTSTLLNLLLAGNETNNGNNFVAYCFAPVVGYSSFGSYTGNGSSDGPFVYTGFRPRWVLIKSTGTTNGWGIIDTARNTYNVSGTVLEPNSSNAEQTYTQWQIDALSNGFKIRSGAFNETNGSGVTYIYAAFAESPFNYARAR